MEVVLGHKGIQELIKYLDDIERSMNSLIDDIEKALAKEGYQLLLANAPTRAIDGNQVGHVFKEAYKDGYRVVYSGQDVAYIEFGTGYIGENGIIKVR